MRQWESDKQTRQSSKPQIAAFLDYFLYFDLKKT
jgi:hypothetical protein